MHISSNVFFASPIKIGMELHALSIQFHHVQMDLHLVKTQKHVFVLKLTLI